jgi:hypothetical protein
LRRANEVGTKKEGFLENLKFFRRLLGGGWGAGGQPPPKESKIRLGIFSEINSDFIQNRQPFRTKQNFRLILTRFKSN